MDTVPHVFYVVILILVGVLGCCLVQAQFTACPQDARSCCECVTKPGCMWSTTPNDNTSSSRCVQDDGFSQIVNELDIPPHLNRPFNPSRHRFLKPQSAKLTMSIGLRKEIPIQVLAQSRRLRLIVVGPNDFPEFSIERGNGMSCARRFKVRERINRRRKQKKISIECVVSAQGQSQRLNLIVDMTKCFKSIKEIKLIVRQRGSRRFKLQVTSSCQCPCQSSERPEEGLEMCEEDEAMTQCVTGTGNTEADNQCSGVNNYCRRDQNTPACSGRGSCICGVCSCNYILSHNDDLDTDTAIMLDPDNMPTSHRHRYGGPYCQCDNLSCPYHNQLICGGPDRGECQCGSCVCHDGYSGAACEQSSDSATCMDPNGAYCSDHGDCVDGLCHCHEEYFGPFCEQCVTCSNKCDMLAPCVQCFAFDEIETNQNINCTAMCSSIENPPISFTLSDGSWPETSNLCVLPRNGCHFEFAYTWEASGEMTVYYINEMHCHEDH